MSDQARNAGSDERTPRCPACEALDAFERVTQLTMQYEREAAPLTLPMWAYLTGMAAGALAIVGRQRGRLCADHSLETST